MSQNNRRELEARLPDGVTLEDCGDLGTLDAVLQGDYP